MFTELISRLNFFVLGHPVFFSPLQNFHQRSGLIEKNKKSIFLDTLTILV